jgi:hypothetical protein
MTPSLCCVHRECERRRGHRTFRADAIRSIDLSLSVYQGLGADFRRRSAFSSAALWGRKAETDRVLLLGFQRGGLADPPPRASNEDLPSILLPFADGTDARRGPRFSYYGPLTRLARRVSRRLCRRSEEAAVVRGRRKAETDRVREGISEGFRSPSPPQPLRRRGSLELFSPDVTSFAAPATSPPS